MTLKSERMVSSLSLANLILALARYVKDIEAKLAKGEDYTALQIGYDYKITVTIRKESHDLPRGYESSSN